MDNSTLLSIKEFAAFTGVNPSTLRYYDEIGLLPPASRGSNNYRYYVPFQILTLHFINLLIDLGVPLSKVKEMTKNRTPGGVLDTLDRQEAMLDHHLSEIRTAYALIHTFRKNIRAGLLAREDDIKIQKLEEEHIALGQENNFGGEDKSFYKAFVLFYDAAEEYRINLRYPIGGYYEDMNAFVNAPDRPQKFFSLDPQGNGKRAAGPYLVGYRRGHYGDFGDLPSKMDAYAGSNALVLNGPVYAVYLLDEVSTVDPTQYLAQVAVGVSGGR